MTRIRTFVTFIALLAWAWGGALWAHGAGTDSVPWAVYTQSFHLSGVPSIGLMSLAMVLAKSTQAKQQTEVWFCGPDGLGQRVRAGLKRKLGWRLRFHQ